MDILSHAHTFPQKYSRNFGKIIIIMIAKVCTVTYYDLHIDILLFNILGHFSGIFEDTIYACDLLEGTKEKDWVDGIEIHVKLLRHQNGVQKFGFYYILGKSMVTYISHGVIIHIYYRQSSSNALLYTSNIFIIS